MCRTLRNVEDLALALDERRERDKLLEAHPACLIPRVDNDLRLARQRWKQLLDRLVSKHHRVLQREDDGTTNGANLAMSAHKGADRGDERLLASQIPIQGRLKHRSTAQDQYSSRRPDRIL